MDINKTNKKNTEQNILNPVVPNRASIAQIGAYLTHRITSFLQGRAGYIPQKIESENDEDSNTSLVHSDIIHRWNLAVNNTWSLQEEKSLGIRLKDVSLDRILEIFLYITCDMAITHFDLLQDYIRYTMTERNKHYGTGLIDTKYIDDMIDNGAYAHHETVYCVVQSILQLLSGNDASVVIKTIGGFDPSSIVLPRFDANTFDKITIHDSLSMPWQPHEKEREVTILYTYFTTIASILYSICTYSTLTNVFIKTRTITMLNYYTEDIPALVQFITKERRRDLFIAACDLIQHHKQLYQGVENEHRE